MIYTALIQYLKGNISNTRIFGNYAPQNTILPCVVVDLSGSSTFRTFSSSGASNDLIQTDFEISIFAETQLSSTQLADEITAFLQNKRALIGDGSSPEVTHRIADVIISSEVSGFDASVEHYSHSLFITITHT